MMILADVSGIQEFVFHVPREEGHQAKMLRARSFFIQLFTEGAAQWVLKSVGAKPENLIFCAAGKFLIELEEDIEEQVLQQCKAKIETWLIHHPFLGGQIRFSMAWTRNDTQFPTAKKCYLELLYLLQLDRQHSWKSVAAPSGVWDSSRLCLPVSDDEKEKEFFKKLGQLLSQNCYEIVAVKTKDADTDFGDLSKNKKFDLLGKEAQFFSSRTDAISDSEIFWYLPLKEGIQSSFDPKKKISRPLLRYVPHENGQILEFENIGEKSKGADYLGVLKMDADSMGDTFLHRLEGPTNFKTYIELSQKLDDFFSKEIDSLMRKDFKYLYTVFSGGDDLLVVGPWDQVFDFAYTLRNCFNRKFKGELTISAGMAVVRNRFPIRFAVEQAEDALKQAKGEKNSGTLKSPKDSFCCFGQVWKWDDHPQIYGSCDKLANWVGIETFNGDGTKQDREDKKKPVQRGWLSTLFELSELRRYKPPTSKETPQEKALQEKSPPRIHPALAASRLAYHIERNWPSKRSNDPIMREARKWIEDIAKHFIPDETDHIDTVYFSTIIRYAMLATRSRRSEENHDEE